MAKESKAQQETIERVLHEVKEGDLKTSAGKTVKSKKQAVAIALREAGASNPETPEKNKNTLHKAKIRERAAD